MDEKWTERAGRAGPGEAGGGAVSPPAACTAAAPQSSAESAHRRAAQIYPGIKSLIISDIIFREGKREGEAEDGAHRHQQHRQHRLVQHRQHRLVSLPSYLRPAPPAQIFRRFFARFFKNRFFSICASGVGG